MPQIGKVPTSTNAAKLKPKIGADFLPLIDTAWMASVVSAMGRKQTLA